MANEIQTTTYDPKPRFSDTYVVCPWCGHEHGDAWEWASKRTETRCDRCDNMFTVDPDYSVTYHSFVTGKEQP